MGCISIDNQITDEMLKEISNKVDLKSLQAASLNNLNDIDENLKTDITLVGKAKNGIEIFTWKWNELAKKLGLNKNPEVGVIAQKVMKTHPDFVKRHKDGYLTVNYEVLNV